MLDRYEKTNAASRISEYYSLSLPWTSKTEAFERAKKQTVEVIQKALNEVKDLNEVDFFSELKAGRLNNFWPWQGVCDKCKKD